MNKQYSEYLKSVEWAQIKIDLYTLRGKKCELCESTKNIAIHHRTYDRIFNEEPADLIILCGKCHFKIHKKELLKKKKNNNEVTNNEAPMKMLISSTMVFAFSVRI